MYSATPGWTRHRVRLDIVDAVAACNLRLTSIGVARREGGLTLKGHRLQELAEEVRTTKRPRTVDTGPDVVAVIKPIRRTRRSHSATNYETLWQVVGMGASDQPTDIAQEKGALLAEAYEPKQV